jgi:hypothetical protein
VGDGLGAFDDEDDFAAGGFEMGDGGRGGADKGLFVQLGELAADGDAAVRHDFVDGGEGSAQAARRFKGDQRRGLLRGVLQQGAQLPDGARQEADEAEVVAAQAGDGEGGDDGGGAGQADDLVAGAAGGGNQIDAGVGDGGGAGVGDERNVGFGETLKDMRDAFGFVVVGVTDQAGMQAAVRVSSAATSSTSPRMRRARRLASSRLPMGVATT